MCCVATDYGYGLLYTSKLMQVVHPKHFRSANMEISSSEQKPKVRYIFSNQYSIVTELLTKEKPSALRSIIAGSTAGAVEIGNVIPGLHTSHPSPLPRGFNSKRWPTAVSAYQRSHTPLNVRTTFALNLHWVSVARFQPPYFRMRLWRE